MTKSKAWDQAAKQYAQGKIPCWGEDETLCFLEETIPMGPEWSILDVGCGSGLYALAFAQRVGSVTGIDSSAAMIEAARFRGDQEAVKNVEYEECSFEDFSTTKRFDVVFARLTPAVSSRSDLLKMESLSQNWCVYSSTENRVDVVLERAEQMVGLASPSRKNKLFDQLYDLAGETDKEVFSRTFQQNWPTPHTREENRWYYESVARSEGRTEDQVALIADAADRIYIEGLVEPSITASMKIIAWKCSDS